MNFRCVIQPPPEIERLSLCTIRLVARLPHIRYCVAIVLHIEQDDLEWCLTPSKKPKPQIPRHAHPVFTSRRHRCKERVNKFNRDMLIPATKKERIRHAVGEVRPE